jgi:Spy/CpxP family protein refolding chaperone
MKTTAVLGGLALALGMALPVAAQPPDVTEAVQAQMGPGSGGPGMGGPGMGGPGMGGPGMEGRGGWQKHARHGHMRRGRSVIFSALRNQKELGLSPQQVSSLQQLGMDARRASIKRRADGQLARLDLFGLLRAEPVDMGKVEAKVREIERLKADGAIARIRTNEAAKAQLSPEQREKLKTLRAARWQRGSGGGRRSGGEGGGDGGSGEPSSMQERS